ncbi:TIGR02221 family CRISPR-associated protein [Synechococcus sp. JA-3-3Ab]|uniref:TIGR02221 family CRISPR-associated protein n=1 Tax=Synechococcus sp. (strain JA-3-3Ab) TaxID=321327 RepID=UPI0000694821|nr:TIGR02221 family CRISPR-associated protein [Synechococcus sp. JA-3-3Ab]ABD00667.1 CRISPR-associated protein, TM1812 family [Synechococcus sp. JA-3-3Ab]
MAKTLLTTLGTGDYTETTYFFGEQRADKTCYVAKALCQLFEIDRIILLLTEEARAKHWGRLQESLPPQVEKVAKAIPEGKTEAETWEIFDVLVDGIEPNSRLLFDITHAFRSIPLLVLLGAALLRKAKNVEIQGLYYGLYRPGQAETPIIDLTPAIRLLDWLTASDKFISTGSAVELGQLLDTVQRDFYRQQRPGKGDPRPTRLQSFGQAIRDISRSLELVRPVSLQEDLRKLQRHSTQELAEEVGQFAKPFGLLLQSIQNSYSQLALPAEKAADPQAQVQKHFQLLRWYVEKRFTTQALLLAREWVVSALCLCEGIQNYLEREARQGIEHQLGSLIPREEQLLGDLPATGSLIQHQEQLQSLPPIAAHVPDVQQLAKLWSRLSEYRNDVAHVQMKPKSLRSEVLESFVLQDLLPKLEALFPELTRTEGELEGDPSNSR